MTRLWPEGDPIKVLLSQEQNPEFFYWQGQQHQVLEIVKKWRIQTDWWRKPIWRDYFKMITHSGLLVVVYHDLQTTTWYLQRLYD